jgi:hypothetical protein
MPEPKAGTTTTAAEALKLGKQYAEARQAAKTESWRTFPNR